MNIYGVIYKITNKINGKIYIGQTTMALRSRWYKHCDAKQPYCRVLSRAIKKYGKENFIIEEICKCYSLEELNKKEIFYIKNFKTMVPDGYNLTIGGDVHIISEETRAKMSNSKKGKLNSFYGKHHTDYSKKLLSISGKIAQNRTEVIEKKSKSQIGNNHALGYKHTIKDKKLMSGLNWYKNHLNLKLSKKQVCLIRRLYSTENYTQKELAVLFGVSPNHISNIINYKRGFSNG